MIDERTPHNAKAVELFTTHLPEWFAPIVIEAHLKSCDLDKDFMLYYPNDLKQAFALNVNWDILNLGELGQQTEGNEIQVGSEALSEFYELFVNSPKAQETAEVATSNEKVASSELKLSPDAIEYFNRIAETEKGKKAVVITDPWLIIGGLAAMTIGCSILGAFFFKLMSQLFQ